MDKKLDLKCQVWEMEARIAMLLRKETEEALEEAMVLDEQVQYLKECLSSYK